VQPIIEVSGVLMEAGREAPIEPRARHPLSLVAHDREIVSIWLPRRPAMGAVARVLLGDAHPSAGEVRRRAGARVALVRADESMERAFLPSVDLALVDATGRGLSLDTWVRLATERARGAGVVVLTHSVADAYRCDRAVLALWSISELLSALDSVVEAAQGATRDLLAGAAPRRTGVLAVELQRASRAVRDLIDLARRMAHIEEDRLRLQVLAAAASGVLLDERVLEDLIAESERL
jgi:hypothetical protein